jgi:poly(A) polymerase
LAWAALFHDLGKRECFTIGADRIRFDGHDTLGADRARDWLREHGASAEVATQVGEIVAEHIRIVSVPEFRPAKRNRFLSGSMFWLHHEFHRADCLACHRQLGIYETLRQQREALPPDLPEPLLRGRDLVALGVPSGPRIGRLLAAVEEARFAGEIRTIEEARELVQELLAKGSI